MDSSSPPIWLSFNLLSLGHTASEACLCQSLPLRMLFFLWSLLFFSASTSPHLYHTHSANSLYRLGRRFHLSPCYVTHHLPLFGKGHSTQQVTTKSGVNWNMCCAQVCNKKRLINIRRIQPYVHVCLRIYVYMGNVVYSQVAFK